jgi:hypothetical protein
MKLVPIRKKSSITPIALASLRHKACVICSDDDYVPIYDLASAYEHAWDHWDAWSIIRDMVPGQLEIPLIWQNFYEACRRLLGKRWKDTKKQVVGT